MLNLIIKAGVVAAVVVFALPLVPIKMDGALFRMAGVTAAVIGGLFAVKTLKLA